jgi:hypothetical protein
VGNSRYGGLGKYRRGEVHHGKKNRSTPPGTRNAHLRIFLTGATGNNLWWGILQSINSRSTFVVKIEGELITPLEGN